MRAHLKRGTDRLTVVVSALWYAFVTVQAGGPRSVYQELRADAAWAMVVLVLTPASVYLALLVVAWIVDGFLPDHPPHTDPDMPFGI